MCISSIHCLSQYSHNISRCYLEAIFPSPRYNYNVVLIIEINKRTGLNFKVERQYITVGHLPFLLWGLWIMGQWWGAFVWKKSRFFFHPLWTTKTNSPFTSTGGRKKLDISKNEWQNLHIIKYNVLYMKKKTFFLLCGWIYYTDITDWNSWCPCWTHSSWVWYYNTIPCHLCRDSCLSTSQMESRNSPPSATHCHFRM